MGKGLTDGRSLLVAYTAGATVLVSGHVALLTHSTICTFVYGEGTGGRVRIGGARESDVA